MKLHVRRWGTSDGCPSVVCLHGVAQHGGVFAGLAKRLQPLGGEVVAFDLRGHGRSGKEPPWNVDTHVADVVETMDSLGLRSASFVGHSFGARIALALAAAWPSRAKSLALLEPGIDLNPALALRRVEIERLDWSYATKGAAVRALVGAGVPAHAHAAIEAFVQGDLEQGSDGRYRLSYSPGAVVVAWSEICLPLPRPASEILVVRAEDSGDGPDTPGRDWLRDVAEIATVPNGHNVLWEAPEETAEAVRRFLASTWRAGAAVGAGAPEGSS